MSDSEGDLRGRLAAVRGGWRELPDELRGRPDLAERLSELEALAESDPDVDIRYKARKVLSALDSNRARPAAPAQAAPLGGLREALAEAEAATRGRVLERFAQAHRGSGVDEILALLPSEPDPQALSVMARLIGQYGNASHLRDLRPLLTHANPRVVANAVEAMGRCDAGAALPMVLPALMSEDHRVRGNVLIVLYESSREETLGYLTRMAASPQESYRAAAIWCLGQIQDPAGEAIALAALRDEEAPDLVDALVRYLDEHGTVAALPELKRTAKEQPRRAARVRLLIESIGARLRVPPEELARFVGRASTSARVLAAVSGGFRRLKKSLQGIRTRRRPAPLESAPGAESHETRGRRAALLALSCAGLALVYVYRRDATPSGGWVEVSETRSSAAGAARQKPGTPIKVSGTVSAVAGSTLVMKHGYTVYAVKYRDRRMLAQVKPGQRVSLHARYRAWNESQGYVELDAAASR